MNLLHVPAYCINLRRRMDRRDEAERVFKSIGLPVQFIHGVEGSEVMSEEDYRLHCWANDGKKRKNLSMKIAGHIGCTLSHQKVIGTALKEHPDAPCYLILEDDATPVEGFWERWREVSSEFPPSWDIISLGSRPKLGSQKCSPNIRRVGAAMWQTHSYLLNSHAAPALYRLMSERRFPADINWSAMLARGNSYTCWPPLMYQRDSFSDIEGREVSYNR